MPRTANPMEIEIRFEALPLFKGVKDSPGGTERLPLHLHWDPRGFIAQSTPEEVREKVVKAYASDEFTFITPPPGSSPWSDRLGKVKIDFTRRATGSFSGKSMLEVGAGSLYLAEHFTAPQTGASKYTVVDPAIRQATDNPDIEIIREYFSRGLLKGRGFDLVTSFNCLEHLPDPVGFLLDVREIIAESRGRAIISFPNVQRQFSNGDFCALVHEHLNYFTHETATALLQRCGLEVFMSETENDLMFFPLRPGGHPPLKPSLAGRCPWTGCCRSQP